MSERFQQAEQTVLVDVAQLSTQALVARDCTGDPTNTLYLLRAEVMLHLDGAEADGIHGTFESGFRKNTSGDLSEHNSTPVLTQVGAAGAGVAWNPNGQLIECVITGVTSGANLKGRVQFRLHLDSSVGTIAAGCFIAGTMVHTPSGLVAIEKLKVGAQVMGYSLAQAEEDVAKAAVAAHVTATRSVGVRPVFKLKAGALQVTGTEEHPFWRPEIGGWVPMGELEAGHQLLLADGSTVEVESVAAVKKPAKVFNLTVDGVHNFRVGEAGALVHNK